MKRADRLKASYALILGEDELARGVVTVKDMRASEQTQVGRDQILEYCRARRAGGQE
jgi:histidyl-tRNA synthetase